MSIETLGCFSKDSREYFIEMKAVYECLVKLLGQPPEGIVFDQFVTELGCEPFVDFQSYTIPPLGVTLFVVESLFSIVLIEIDTPSTRQRTMSRYDGDLPNGIDRDDGPKTIAEKLSVQPVSSEILLKAGLYPKDFQNVYEMPPLILQFQFTPDTEKLSSITISLSSQSHWAANISPSSRPRPS